ncbi:DNase I-like protein [Thelephora ganbajun]|uniref:DNase I-like protein n=1 Tax=Thelephora ganbajun TaxID=370292 RepID=A0ACB6ZQR6_THEGA|nr:DNase I-like protein [Thelephora ganbajun]
MYTLVLGALYLISTAYATTIGSIQGPTFLSAYDGQTLTNITGFVTVKGSSAFWLADEKFDDQVISTGITVFSTSPAVLGSVQVGDLVSLNAKVSEFRPASRPNDLHLTELVSPTNITVLSSGNPIVPIVLGRDRSPPTQYLSSLDSGPDGFLSVPANQSLQDMPDRQLQPASYGLDFWESLEGQVVTIPTPISLGFNNFFKEFWVRGDWGATSINSRGGLTITFGPDGIPDANPEAIIVGTPLDGTENVPTALGNVYEDITGVITFQFGFYYVLPFTAPKVISSPNFSVPPSAIGPSGAGNVITVGDYNVENMAPNSSHVPAVANHIAKYLNMPDITFIQEIQDDSGPTDDGIVSANLTLTTLVNAIQEESGILYSFINIDPIDKQDGGQPGGNIRQAFLYRAERVKLLPGTPGGALDSTSVREDGGMLSLTLNPGRIDPTNVAWTRSRKPLVAAWETPSGDTLFTINVHFSSKDRSSSTQGDARPFVNGAVDQRTQQVKVATDFINSILVLNKDANIVIAGDFNEFVQTRSVYAPFDGLLAEIDESSGLDPVERYTYIFDQNCQQLDHIFVSNAIAGRGTLVEHVHVNNWGSDINTRASDHDPTVARIIVS